MTCSPLTHGLPRHQLVVMKWDSSTEDLNDTNPSEEELQRFRFGVSVGAIRSVGSVNGSPGLYIYCWLPLVPAHLLYHNDAVVALKPFVGRHS